jgi:hypothetical protein
VEVMCEIIWSYKTASEAKLPWLPEREKEEGGKGAGSGAGEGDVERGVEKDDKQCTYDDDPRVLSPAFLSKFNDDYLEPSL